MAIGVLILGESGTGKTHSIKGFDPEEVKVISLFKPILPFRGHYEVVKVDRSADAIIKEMKNTKKKAIVIDDFQFLLGVPMMKRIGEKGWDKFNDIQQPYSDVLFALDELPDDTIVYFNSHVEVTEDGNKKIKTIGKALDKYLTVEGLFMIVLGTLVVDGETEKKYYFTTQNNGKDTVKSPEGMFPAYAIDNDLKYVDEKIRSYYELGEFLTDEEMKEKDAAVAHDEVAKEEPKKRSRSRGKKEEAEAPKEEATTEAPKEEPTTEPAEAPAEPPKRTRRRVSEAEELAKAGVDETGKTESVPFDEVEVPQRKRRTKTEEMASEEAQEEAEPTEEPTTRRRRRR